MVKTRAELLFGRSKSKLPSGGKRLSGSVELTWADFQQQIGLLPLFVDKAALDFTVVIAQRAETVFRHSFKNHEFYSSDGEKWADDSLSTKRKRAFRGTWPGVNGVLGEYGVLMRSVQIKEVDEKKIAHKFSKTVWTDPLAFNGSKFHKGFVYAGVHNDPSSTDT